MKAPRRAELGSLLAVVPRLPSGAADRELSRLLAELCRDWAVDVLAAGPSAIESAALKALGPRAGLALPRSEAALLARCREALSAKEYAAAVLVDDPSTRAALQPLKGFSKRPLVLALLGRAEGLERPRAALDGDGFSARRRSREAAARQACAADEIWAFGGGTADIGRFARRPRCEAAWMTGRLRALGRPTPPRGLTSIIVPCFNGLAYTKQCLESVAAHTKARHEVIVVDNGSTDGTTAYARARARVVRNETNLGFAKAINQGMRAARGRYLVWLNNDVVVTPGWLERLIECADRAPWIAAVGPCTNETVGFQRVEAPALKRPRDLAMFSQAWALRHAGQAQGVHRLTGFCLLLKREAVDRVGFLDERFGVGTYEEFDYCLRLRQAGYDLAVARDAFVLHHGHKTFRSFAAMAEQARRNREIFLDKWCHQALGFLDELNPEAARG